MLPAIIQTIQSYEWVTVTEMTQEEKTKVFFYCRMSCPIRQERLDLFFQMY